MDKSKLSVGAKVKLKDGPDALYAKAFVGSEGWIKDIKLDEDGFELAYVVWDKKDWRYNGQDDGWTFASHFDLITLAKEGGTPRLLVEAHKKRGFDDIEKYIEEVEKAFESIAGSEGFLVLSVHRMPDPKNPKNIYFIPHLRSASQTDEAHASLSIALADALLNNHQEMLNIFLRGK